jgi:hypothetical protein
MHISAIEYTLSEWTLLHYEIGVYICIHIYKHTT